MELWNGMSKSGKVIRASHIDHHVSNIGTLFLAGMCFVKLKLRMMQSDLNITRASTLCNESS